MTSAPTSSQDPQGRPIAHSKGPANRSREVIVTGLVATAIGVAAGLFVRLADLGEDVAVWVGVLLVAAVVIGSFWIAQPPERRRLER